MGPTWVLSVPGRPHEPYYQGYPSETHVKPKPREFSFAHNLFLSWQIVLKLYKKNSITVVLCEKFQIYSKMKQLLWNGGLSRDWVKCGFRMNIPYCNSTWSHTACRALICLLLSAYMNLELESLLSWWLASGSLRTMGRNFSYRILYFGWQIQRQNVDKGLSHSYMRKETMKLCNCGKVKVYPRMNKSLSFLIPYPFLYWRPA